MRCDCELPDCQDCFPPKKVERRGKPLDEQAIYDIRLLYYTQGKPFQEISKLTGHSTSTISKYCWRDRDGHSPQAAAAAQGK